MDQAGAVAAVTVMRALCGSFVLLTVALAFAQEVDYGPPTTIFDEIGDKVEREAFRDAWNAGTATLRQQRAEAFVTRYPRSIVLREAYEISARALVELGDLPAALDRAGTSLRLLPENPFLLVLVADTAAKQSQLERAELSAREALRQLANAYQPGAVTREEWDRVRNELRAVAHFVIGRVAATRGAYSDARQSLLTALSLNPADMEALYTLGAVQIGLKDESGAAASLAHVMRAPGPLALPARNLLQTMHARRSPSVSFDAFVSALRWDPPAAERPASARTLPAGAYAGSEACRDCHASIYARWRATGMGRMFREYRPEDVIGDFSGRHVVENRARPLRHQGRHYIDIRDGETSNWTRYPIDYLIGSKWQQAYATRLPDARILVFPVQFNRVKSTWVNYWAIVDAPGAPRADISRFHTIPSGAIYQTSCAPCHTSQLSFTNGMQHASSGNYREGGINCEMCHGPSQAHVDSAKSGATPVRAAHETPVRFGRLPAEQHGAVCAQCHAQSAVHDAGPDGSVNYSTAVPFYRDYQTHLASNFSRRAFFRDGRHRATTFISESFARTACFRRGQATCGSCHDPHPPDAATNPTSLKFRGDPDHMCTQCHERIAEQPERHTRHAAGAEASRCVACHMPRIMDALLFPARTHEIDDIPDAAMTARFGQEDSPNACLTCHTDRNVEWLSEKMTERQRQILVRQTGAMRLPISSTQ